MLPDRQSNPSSSYSSDIIYHEPAVVFTHWYNKFRLAHPGERPTLKWLSLNSKLPYTTCQFYRRRMEAAFPDAYAVAHAAKNLRLANKLRKKLNQTMNKTRFKPPITE